MTVTLEEAQANLPGFLEKAAAGEEVVIAARSGQPAVKLVSVAGTGSRLVQRPEMKGTLTILDHEALLKPLPPGEWGELVVAGKAEVSGGNGELTQSAKPIMFPHDYG